MKHWLQCLVSAIDEKLNESLDKVNNTYINKHKYNYSNYNKSSNWIYFCLKLIFKPIYSAEFKANCVKIMECPCLHTSFLTLKELIAPREDMCSMSWGLCPLSRGFGEPLFVSRFRPAHSYIWGLQHENKNGKKISLPIFEYSLAWNFLN